MNSECFIKSLMLIIVILLMLSCLQNTENFGEIDFTKIQPKKAIPINLTIGNEVYYFISYEQLIKEENKSKIIDALLKDKTFMDSRENVNDVKKGNFYKTPVFLASAGQIGTLTNNEHIKFVLTAEAGSYVLTPEISGRVTADKYLFFNKESGLIYYATEGPNKDIVYINKNGLVKALKPEKASAYSDVTLHTFGLGTDSDKFNLNITQN
jgi:hypothetical protein